MSEIKIFENIPWAPSMNLAEAYNAFMDKLDDDDWGILRDADTIYTTSDYGKQLYDVIEKYKGVEAFTCMTNRTGCVWQRVHEMNTLDSNDMVQHRNLGEFIRDNFYVDCEDITDHSLASGHFFMIKKSLWNRIAPIKMSGMFGVDNEIHRRIRITGEHMYLIKGLYIYHWYSGAVNSVKRDISHLKKIEL